MNRILVFLCGLLVGAILFGSAVSFAFTGSSDVTAEYSDIKIVVDGTLVKTNLEPFILNDRVYVPLRVVAEAMGKEVGWENNTVLIGTQKQSLVLTDLMMPTETSVKCSYGSALKVNGVSYSRGFYVQGKDSPTGSLNFYVRGKGIKEINGSIGLDDSNPDSQAVELAVFKDSTKVWEGIIKKGDNPVPINFQIEDNINTVYFKFNKVAKAKIDFIDFAARY